MREHKAISIADQIFEQLERDILTGHYHRGEVLTELRLSQELGVSRTPIREALRRLEQEDLIKDTGRGAEVLGISREDMLDMLQIRLATEGLVARRAAEKASPEELREMKEMVELLGFYVDRDSGEYTDQIRELDEQFHELVYEASGSRMFQQIMGSLHRKMGKYRMASVSRHSRAVETYHEHLEIYKAMASHDPEAVQRAVEDHIGKALHSMASVEIEEA